MISGCSKHRTHGLYFHTGAVTFSARTMCKMCANMLNFLLCAGEVQWIHPALPLDLLWDDSLSSSREADPACNVQGVLPVALNGPLLPAQQQQVLVQLQSQPKRVFSCGLTPQKLPQLVELNPAIAVEVDGPLLPHAGTPCLRSYPSRVKALCEQKPSNLQEQSLAR